MEEEFLLMFAAEQIKRRQHLERRRLLKQLRDRYDPFKQSDSTFIKTFRLPKSVCWNLIQELQPHDEQRSSIPFALRLLATLYFYANGSYQKCVGNNFSASMSQSSVSRAIQHISQLIVSKKSSEIYFPVTIEEQVHLKRGFHQRFGIKGTIGAIDCTHVGIVAPSANDTVNPLSLYMNRKGYYSINVEAVCDHRLKFTSINAKFPGSCHDSGIWTTSAVRVQLIRSYNSQQNTWLLGDQGYPLEPWLLTPIAEPSNVKEVTFNKLHCKARNTIERAFGVLKSRFRCLSKHRILHYGHKNAANIIYACSILHNILVDRGVSEVIEEEIIDEDINSENINMQEESTARNTAYLREGENIRSRYVMTL